MFSNILLASYFYIKKTELFSSGGKMIVKLEVLYDDLNRHGGRERDEIIRAIDRAMNGATWEASGDGWIARR